MMHAHEVLCLAGWDEAQGYKYNAHPFGLFGVRVKAADTHL